MGVNEARVGTRCLSFALTREITPSRRCGVAGLCLHTPWSGGRMPRDEGSRERGAGWKTDGGLGPQAGNGSRVGEWGVQRARGYRGGCP